MRNEIFQLVERCNLLAERRAELRNQELAVNDADKMTSSSSSASAAGGAKKGRKGASAGGSSAHTGMNYGERIYV